MKTAKILKAHPMGMQISCGVHPEVSRKSAVRLGSQGAGAVFRELAQQKESEVEEGHLMADHVHMLLSIPPKYSVAQVVGLSKGRARSNRAEFMERTKNFVGQHFWARGYYVSTVGRDEASYGVYPGTGERRQRLDQLKMFE